MEELHEDDHNYPAHYFVAVSTRENLDLCREYGLAGFPGSQNGAWAFADIEIGDYVTFVYGAKAHDLYRVTEKRAVTNADDLPPWPPLELTRGGTYFFPFRLSLEPKRDFEESLVRTEFKYIAENLMLRGGYARSHFQADQTTLQQVSQLGNISTRSTTPIGWNVESGTAHWVRRRGGFDPPVENKFIEEILHVLLRRQLDRPAVFEEFVQMTGLESILGHEIEILGERALPEGHVDLLLKDAAPVGEAIQVPIEVKLNRCSVDDFDQLQGYIEQLEPECPGGVLIAERIPRQIDAPTDISIVRANFEDIDMGQPQTMEEMVDSLTLEKVTR